MKTLIFFSFFVSVVSFAENKMKTSKLRHDQSGAVLICDSGRHLIRIDYIQPDDQSKVRYRSYKLGTDKLELDLNGDATYAGSAHNATYTFKNGDYTYKLDNDSVCSDEEYSKEIGRCMPTLTITKSDKTISASNCHP
jgi:hypothetical protein